MEHGVQRMIPLGRTSKAFYALRPAPRGLRPDIEDREEEFPDVKVKDTAFIGVNTNRPTNSPSSYLGDTHRDRRKEQRSNATDSEGDENGFVFHQLGILESARILPRAENDPTKCTFKDASFFVVARLALSGVAEGLYIIYDKFPTDPEEGIRAEFPEKEVAPLPHETGQFSMAKLSGTSLLNGRNFNTQILWLEKRDSPVELVLAKERVMGRGLVRLTVYD
ncbi:uncharacterized protein J3D65DRAFT_332714 [Phyllosticta citribraziliensis]|uniref:Uncharacterized protein n=1 Tax=Phyllosticta citribraziliensis TaxID=989973 RepID=A0ABR1LTN9_9PEZI